MKKFVRSAFGVLLFAVLAFNSYFMLANVPGGDACYGSTTPTAYPYGADGKEETFDCTVGNIVWRNLNCCDESYTTLHSCGLKELYKCKPIHIPVK